MIHVSPVYEVGGLSTRSLKADEAPGGELRAVLGCAKQRLRVGVVIAHPGSRVRGFDAQSVEHRQHRGGLERRAVVTMQSGVDARPCLLINGHVHRSPIDQNK